ncbi:helix-turn-helix transcriptional regulator [Actinophytocola algeriensis]|uniref:DNA-binding CsgD family transcriptional regulator n=1 Tax=Actinophytocola algeriensis TaxID=1768010 RepID=A0A7W7VGV0_9PSEU|nr:LuxR C-terminal-related transcriptional regulator [Actinophytocola algeriensis]MBB4909524.1 DNA-binding CsgD family transcriptional regulator [Actinophytocola algeriensis]MBE1475514.1 DNA-binding CsgD family transcriptional regulator [Actinophytocola algeriensis]
MYDVLDPGRDQGRVYRALAGNRPSDVDRVAAATGLSTEDAARVLAELADLGAAVRTGEGWVARPPVRVMSDVLRAEEARRTALWRAGAELDELYHAARRDIGSATDVEPVADLTELFALTERVQDRARERIRWLDRPPYRSSPERFAAQESLQARRMGAGVAYRTLYHQAVYDDADLFASMTRMIDAGEDARVLADLPVKLVIGDDHIALLVPEPGRSALAGALVVHASGLLNAFCGLFETLWTLGVPVTAAEPSVRLSDRDRTIITLMAAGLTDEAIARRLRLSRRTVVRRITALLDRLGATTRFQAGVQAANRGWL